MNLTALNKITTLTSNIIKIIWFKNVGKEVDNQISTYIENYCLKLNIDKKINKVKKWDEAINVINDKDWNKICWKLEEKEKANLLSILIENNNETEVLSNLRDLTLESSKIIEYFSIADIKKDDMRYQYYSKVAAGAAAICCYQAALAIATNQENNHIFISKYELFKAGHWPLIIKTNTFNIF